MKNHNYQQHRHSANVLLRFFPLLLLLVSGETNSKNSYTADALVPPSVGSHVSLEIHGQRTDGPLRINNEGSPLLTRLIQHNGRTSYHRGRRFQPTNKNPFSNRGGDGGVKQYASSFTPPKFKKSPEQEAFIESVLQVNFLFVDEFESGTESAAEGGNTYLSHLVDAFEEVNFEEGSNICKQGDLDEDGYLYIIHKGECSVTVDGKRLVEPYGTMTEGSLVGDHTMIYDAARASTVEALTPVKAFRLQRQAFNSFLESKATPGNKHPKQKLQQEITAIDNVINQVAGVKTKYEGNIIKPFKPTRRWLWTRWKGTILQQAWQPACWNMLLCFVIQISFRYVCDNVINQPVSWAIGMLPSKDHEMVKRMLGLSKMWNMLMGLNTFVVTFFLNQAYSFWRNVYDKGRRMQGLLNDISMLCASRAERDPETNKYTPRATEALNDLASCIQLFNKLVWASFSKDFGVLLTPKGLSRMLSRGVMTRAQYDCLISIGSGGPQYAALQWIYIRAMKGVEEGALPKTNTMERLLSQKVLDIRGVMGGLRGTLDGKIPLAYAQFVQILVDSFLLLAPFGLYPELGMWSIPAVGLLNLFYSGILDLSKILLFPLENDDDQFCKDTSVNMDLGVLIQECNAGSNVFKGGLATIPF